MPADSIFDGPGVKKSPVFKFDTFIGRVPSDGAACMPVKGLMTRPGLDQSVRTNESVKTRFAKEQSAREPVRPSGKALGW